MCLARLLHEVIRLLVHIPATSPKVCTNPITIIRIFPHFGNGFRNGGFLMITIKEANGEKILVPEMGFAHAFGLYFYDNVGHFLNEMIIVARGGYL